MSETHASLKAKAKANYFQPFTPIHVQQDVGPRVMSRAQGMRVWDADGKEYLDMMAGLWCCNIGYGREEMADTIADQIKQLCYYQSFQNLASEPAIEFAEALTALAPGDLNRIFFGLSGSDSNDTNVKLVWYYNNQRGKPLKKRIISRKGSYHGVTLGAGSMTGLPVVHEHFDLPVSERFVHVDKPHHYWGAPEGMDERAYSQHLAQQLDETIERLGADTVAAFIAEPIIGGGGCIPPSEGYFDAIKPVLDKHDVLLILDEVICGFGRTGEWFGANYYNVQPDLMTIAKGMTSGYIPMGGTFIADKIFDVLKEGAPEIGAFAHGYTYGGHPVAAAAGLKNLEIIKRENLVGNAKETGAYLQQRLDAFAGHPLIGEKRGVAAVAGLELVKDKTTKTPFDVKGGVAGKLVEILYEEGLLCRPVGNTVIFSPALILTREDIDEAMVKFESGLDKFSAEIE